MQLYYLALLLTAALAHGKVLRNNALINKMVSQFRPPEPAPAEPAAPASRGDVVGVMQSVLCRNFPSIPCTLISKDPTLRNLIEKSIQQIKYKKMTIDKTTQPPNYQLTLFPVASEDLSNFVQHDARRRAEVTPKNYWSHEKLKKKKHHKTTVKGRNKIRKFYPHKIKYKDKSKTFDNYYSDEKLSMSVELPDAPGTKRRHYGYSDPDAAVWRIDYMKHGEPSLNIFNYDSDLKGKIVKTGPNVIVDENILEQVARKDVLHPDVYIKKNFVRKNVMINSETMDAVTGLFYLDDKIIFDLGKTFASLAMSRPVLSSHVLDTSTGAPASGLFVELYKKKEESWTLWHNTVTTSDGRIQFPFSKDSMSEGTYKLVFKIEDYYKILGKETLYPYVEIAFKTKADEHYHIPLLLSPYGYTTYRGS